MVQILCNVFSVFCNESFGVYPCLGFKQEFLLPPMNKLRARKQKGIVNRAGMNTDLM